MSIRKIILQKLAHLCSSTLSNYPLDFVNMNSCIYCLSIHVFTNSSSDALMFSLCVLEVTGTAMTRAGTESFLMEFPCK